MRSKNRYMKKEIWIILFIVLGFACNKTELNTLSFDVSTTTSTYKVGDTVNFKISGNADYIVFYSGENGSQYQFKDRTSALGVPLLSFLTYRQYGNHVNTLQLMVSSDFKGTYDSTNIQNSTWTDITSRAIFSTGKDSTPSGIINLLDFVHGDTPVYVGFRFYDQKDSVNSQRTWSIRNLSLINKLQDSTSTKILDMSSGWLGINMQNAASIWSISSSLFKISGGDKNANTNEDWLISQPVKLTRVLPDVGLSIKTLVDPSLKSYNYIFKNPGNYIVVFDAKNANQNNSRETQKTLNISVTQ